MSPPKKRAPRTKVPQPRAKKLTPGTEGLLRFLRVDPKEKLPEALSRGQKSQPQAYGA